MPIDDIVNTEVHKKPYSPLQTRILAATLAASLFAAGAVAPALAFGDGSDAPKGTGTEQVQIDLSQYTKVAEQDGLAFYISNYSSSKPMHNPDKKTNPDWHSTPTKFYDFLIFNNTDSSVDITRLYSKATTNPGPALDIGSDVLIKKIGTSTIQARSNLVIPDRFAWNKKGIWPMNLKDEFTIKGNSGSVNLYKFEYSIQ